MSVAIATEVVNYQKLLDALRGNRITKLNRVLWNTFSDYRRRQFMQRFVGNINNPTQGFEEEADKSLAQIDDEFIDAIYNSERLTTVVIDLDNDQYKDLLYPLMQIPHINKFSILIVDVDGADLVFSKLPSCPHITKLKLSIEHVEDDVINNVIRVIDDGLKADKHLKSFGLIVDDVNIGVARLYATLRDVIHITTVKIIGYVSQDPYDNNLTDLDYIIDLIVHKPVLHSLKIQTNNASRDIYVSLLERQRNTEVKPLQRLKIRNGQLFPELAEYLDNTNDLRYFALVKNFDDGPIQLEDITPILKSAIDNKGILGLKFNQFNVDDHNRYGYNRYGYIWSIVADLLVSNKTLERIEIEESTVSDEHPQRLLDVLQTHPKLKYLNMSFPGVYRDGKVARLLDIPTLSKIEKFPRLEYFGSKDRNFREVRNMVIDFYRNSLLQTDIDIFRPIYNVDDDYNFIDMKNYLVEINRILGHLFNGNFSIINKPLASPALRKDISDFQIPLAIQRVPLEIQMELLKDYLFELKRVDE